MSVLLRSSIRPKHRAKGQRTTPSIREVCLLTAPTAALAPGAQARWLGRTYRVEAAQRSTEGAPGYLHVSCLGED